MLALSLLQTFPLHGEEHNIGEVPGRESVRDGYTDRPPPPPRNIVVSHLLTEDYHGRALSYPSKLFIDPVKREVYVTDSGHSRILVYTHDFYPLLTIGKTDGIEAPIGISLDAAGTMYVAQSPSRGDDQGRVSVFSPSLRWIKDIYFQNVKGFETFQPRNVVVHSSGLIYVAGSGVTGVVVLKRDGSYSHRIIPEDRLEKGETEQASVIDVEIDSAGKIYLLSEDMGRVYVYDRNEKFLFKFGQKGGTSGKLSRPRGLAVDNKRNRIYVIDYMRHAANVYSGNGRYLFEFGGKGWGRGWLQYPSDIAVDARGRVLIADTFNNRVQVLSLD